MPASSQTSPTSAIALDRRSPQPSQRIGTVVDPGAAQLLEPVEPAPVARSASSALEPITVRCPHAHG